VIDTSTSQHHLVAFHKGDYRKWCTQNDFTSMLAEDMKARKAQKKNDQGTLDEHVWPEAPKERVVAYSDEGFHEAAIQWLINTDQPLSALERPSFRKMIDFAACAKNGVRIPDRRVTR
ncbi:hypothetical protein B0H21DRAFT_701957, partial [Amylocystis lapponica]